MDRRERPLVAVVLAALAAVAAHVVGMALSESRLGRVDGQIAGGATVVVGFALVWTWGSAAARARETDRAPAALVRAERLRQAARRALRGEPGTLPAAGLEPLPPDARLDRR
ncbi:MAG TPA: hypothetical protein VGV57_13800 [Thermoleophilaceae bacterium]|nr:hypothetical protein [Thermoleophilaceae bacterium]